MPPEHHTLEFTKNSLDTALFKTHERRLNYLQELPSISHSQSSTFLSFGRERDGVVSSGVWGLMASQTLSERQNLGSPASHLTSH